jgi:hypothetical protein
MGGHFASLTEYSWMANFGLDLVAYSCDFFLVAEVAPIIYDAFSFF